MVVVAILALLIGWFGHQYLGTAVTHVFEQITEKHESAKEEPKDEEPSGTLCAQVVTPARNPSTGEIKEFPTPCDVPEGWVEIQNDVPGL